MTRLRIQNKASGDRGVYIGGELFFIKSGSTQTWDNATDAEVEEVTPNRDFRAQAHRDGEWVDLSPIVLPDARPWLALATDAAGGNIRYLDLREGEWYVGTALSSEKPGGPEGYAWTKVGEDEVDAKDLIDGASIRSDFEANGVSVDSVINVIAGRVDEYKATFDAASYLDQNGNTVIAMIAKDAPTPDQLDALHAAETTGKNRKGVLAAIEELQTAPEPDATN